MTDGYDEIPLEELEDSETSEYLSGASSIDEALSSDLTIYEDADYEVEDGNEKVRYLVENDSATSSDEPIDKDYETTILSHYESAMSQINTALTSMSNDLISGAEPRAYEVYGNLVKIKLDAIKDMSTLRFNKKKLTLDSKKVVISEKNQALKEKIQENKQKPVDEPDIDGNGNGGVAMTPQALAEFISQMKKLNAGDAVQADYSEE